MKLPSWMKTDKRDLVVEADGSVTMHVHIELKSLRQVLSFARDMADAPVSWWERALLFAVCFFHGARTALRSP